MTLPTGTVTFLRSDIEGSMEHARALGARYDELNAEHAGLVRAVVAEHGGEVVRTEGDAFFVVFTDAGPAARAAVDIQRAMADHEWPQGHALRLRIGLHTGSAVRAGDDYGGFEVSRAARVAAAGNGGQIVLSDPTRALISRDLPAEWQIDDLGRVRLKGLAEPERLFGLLAPGLRRDHEPLRGTVGATAHLPRRHASFVGRESELTTLGGLLAEARLLTLIGPGGTGKTTLALELARRHAGRYPDGAWFVDLQTVTDPARVRAALARDLGLFDGPTGLAVDRLVPFVADRGLLIVIDNFEHVVEAADVVTELLHVSPATDIIVTSRNRLALAAEQAYPVRPLGLSDQGDEPSEAVRLFLDRARQGKPGLVPGDDELRKIEQLCRLVDGLPLAIELCAARVDILPVERIHERLSERLPLPGSGPRDLPQRQRTIEGTVAWSLDLLDEPTRRLFAQLGVFAGSFDLEQAEDVCGGPDDTLDVLEGLARLIEQSLLERRDDPLAGVRFGMIETIRMVALDRLEATPGSAGLRGRHVRAYLRLAASIFPWHHEPVVAAWLDRLEADDDNLRSATRWAIDSGSTEEALGLVGYLWKYWVHGGRRAEGGRLTQEALALEYEGPPSEARVWAIAAAGSLAYWANDLDLARARYEEQRDLSARLGYRLCEANAWFSLVFVRQSSGDRAGAEAAAATARRILTELDASEALVELEVAMAVTSAPAALAEPERLLPVLAAQIDRLEQASSPVAEAALPAIRAQYHLAAGELPEAVAAMVGSLRAGLQWRMVGDVITSLSFVAALGVERLAPDIPATILGAVESASQRHGVRGPSWTELLPGLVAADPVAALAAKLPLGQLEAALDRGRRMTLEEVVDYFEAHAAGFARSSHGAADPS